MSPLEKPTAQEEFARGSRIERLKVVRGDRLAFHHTLMDLILNVSTNEGEPSPGSSDPLYDLDSVIEITLRRLRKASNIVVSNSSNSVSSSDNSSLVTSTSDSVEYSSTNNFA
ncbi:hypothetical protein CR513_54501, partial [Mucuna pruriens]